jgi:hypothetical protein
LRGFEGPLVQRRPDCANDLHLRASVDDVLIVEPVDQRQRVVLL